MDRPATDRIEDGQEINEQLENRIIEMNQQLECLEEYRDTIGLKSSEDPSKKDVVESALQSLISVGSNCLIQGEKYVNTRSFDDVYIQWQSNQAPSRYLHCFGCGQEFKVYHTRTEPAYYIHCIKECDKYQDLDLIRKCENCQKCFVGGHVQIDHSCGKQLKPVWMSPAMFFTGVKKTDDTKACLGCQKVFPSNRSGYSYEHLIHMIEDCSEYKKLNMIEECEECHYKFPSRRCLLQHITGHHNMIEKPIWMTSGTYKASRTVHQGRTISSICPGCDKVMEKQKGCYRTEDYIHMIEECKEYKELGLIRTCNKCDCKFINPKSLKHHKC